MLFMVNIVVRLPGDWPKEKLDTLVAAEAASPEELHATLTSLRMHPYMDVGVTPIIRHTTTEAYEAAHGAMPPF